MKRKTIYLGVMVMGLLVLSIALISSCKKKDDSDTEKVKGCMDPTSLTYNALAEEDDGTCVVPEVRQRAVFMDFTATW
jgi:hypothetical protein